MQTIIVTGRLGRDAKIYTSSNGNRFITFSIASNTKVKKNEENTYWWDVVVPSHSVERYKNMVEYLTKGSSVIVTGRVRWIHGSLNDCKVMNERINVPRCYFKKGNCNTTGVGNYAIYSEKQLIHDVSPYISPALKWENNSKRNPVSLYW